MQTSHDNTVISAASQEPVLHKEQLIPGILLVSLAGSYIWSVIDIHGEDIILAKMPYGGTIHDTHTWAVVGNERGQTCHCGFRKTTQAELLPLQADKARFHVIIPKPNTTILIPEKYAIYAYLKQDGSLVRVTINENHQWSETLPIIPTLHKVWVLPNELKAFIE